MDKFKRFATFSRSERIAIIGIVSIIVILLIIKYLIINIPPKRTYFTHDLDSIVMKRNAVMDSMRTADSIEKAKSFFRADNRRKETEDSESYRNGNKGNRKKRHDTVRSGFLPTATSQPANVTMNAIDLNTADTTALKQIPGIGSAFAKWIVNYRAKLGGYCTTRQLMEVYRMDSLRYNSIKDYVKIDSLFVPEKLRINNDSFKTLLKHPYLEYDDVKKIINYREQKGLIASWEQLIKVTGDAINPELRHYIDYR